MDHSVTKRIPAGSFIAALLLLGSLVAAAPAAAQGPKPVPPYGISVFATSPMGTSQPDSILMWRDRIIVGFGNGVAKDGTDGKSSTIVEFSLNGTVKRMFQVKGHNDGLRVVGEDDLWALQNEDANPNLVVIDLESGKQKVYDFAPTPHGGGYDDIAVKDGKVYLSASNPSGNPNTAPVVVRATLAGNSVMLETILNGNDTATDIPTGNVGPLNLQDPDSMAIDPRGNILLTSQADAELVFIRNPGHASQAVGVLSTTSGGAPLTVDDTAFATDPKAFLLVTDIPGNAIYKIDGGTFGFEPGTAYSASDTGKIVGTLNLDTGVVTPIATGFGSPRGLLFVSPHQDHEGRHRDR
jgi:hypothetical protein